MLVLISLTESALLVDAEGRNDPITMSFGEETEFYDSCSVTYRNRFYVFGGYNNMQQISEVTECELRRIGTLGFDHNDGACSNVDDREIYLCFHRYDTSQCRSAVDPLGMFTKIAPSTYYHKFARTAASPSKFQVTYILISFSAKLLAVGSFNPGNVKTEMYLTEIGRWETLQDYPFD